MEAEEAEAVKLHLFSSTRCFEWLKWNNYADVDLIGVADGITKVWEEISNYPPEHVYNSFSLFSYTIPLNSITILWPFFG